MLDLQKLENEINNLIANETAESYNEIFKKMEFDLFVAKVEISGGYTDQFDCPEKTVSIKPNLLDADGDFYDQNLNQAA